MKALYALMAAMATALAFSGCTTGTTNVISSDPYRITLLQVEETACGPEDLAQKEAIYQLYALRHGYGHALDVYLESRIAPNPYLPAPSSAVYVREISGGRTVTANDGYWASYAR